MGAFTIRSQLTHSVYGPETTALPVLFNNMGVEGVLWCPVFLLLQIGFCSIETPSMLGYSVGDNATLKWTATKSILQVRFGLYDPNTDNLSPQFVFVNTLAGVVYTNLTNTAEAGYTGRVQYVGNLTLGYAWFNLIDLKNEDLNKVYATRIRALDEAIETSYPVNLTKKVIAPLSTPTPTSSILSSSSTSPSSSSTTTTKTPISQPQKKIPWWPFVLTAIIVSPAGTVVVCCCCCRKKLEDCYSHVCCCCPCKKLEDCYSHVCCCCPCKIKDRGSSEEQASEMKS